VKSRPIEIQINAIRELIAKTQIATLESMELQAHWARYLCIITAGLVENAIKASYIEFAKRAGSDPVSRYIGSSLDRVRNPNSDELLQLSSKFRETWRVELAEFMNQDGRAAALNSVMSQRHMIAHGDGLSSNISMTNLQNYLEKIIAILQKVDAQCWA
jgi:hypothetical protein